MSSLQSVSIIWTVFLHDMFCLCSVYYTGEIPVEVKIEADSNDITEHPHDDKPRPYLCTVCDKRYTTKQGLNFHKQRHNGEQNHACPQCEKCFATRNTLRQHMNIHTDRYRCPECGKCCKSSHELTRHGKRHSGEKPFECTVCGTRFSRPDNLAKHREIHSGSRADQSFKCHLCGMVCSASGSLNVHMRVHTGDKPYKCSLCSKGFITSSHLQLHKRCIHSSRRPYDCRFCGKRFKIKGVLMQHVYAHIGAKPYSCRHCSESFTRPEQRRRHLLKSHNEGTWLTCHICEKKFSHSGSFNKHVLRHEGVKPYVCSECQKCFYTTSNMKSHMLTHSNVKLFCCGSCGKYFKDKAYVVKHFKTCSVRLGFSPAVLLGCNGWGACFLCKLRLYPLCSIIVFLSCCFLSESRTRICETFCKVELPKNCPRPLPPLSFLGGCSYLLPAGGPMAQVCRLGLKVGSHLALFCIHIANRVNSRNDSITARPTFIIKSRSARTHLKKIWLRGQIFVSHTHEACDVSIPIANSKWPILEIDVLWDIMT